LESSGPAQACTGFALLFKIFIDKLFLKKSKMFTSGIDDESLSMTLEIQVTSQFLENFCH
jgi:hypothetical protein